MIIFCNSCEMKFRIMHEDDHLVGNKSEFWPDKYKCPTCQGPAVCSDVETDGPNVLIKDLEPTELYAAMHGLGVPGEMLCDGNTVRDLLAKGIEKVVGYDLPGTTRFIVEYLITPGGTRIYLGASPHGAIVYRIARRCDYTTKVLEEHNG